MARRTCSIAREGAGLEEATTLQVAIGPEDARRPSLVATQARIDTATQATNGPRPQVAITTRPATAPIDVLLLALVTDHSGA